MKKEMEKGQERIRESLLESKQRIKKSCTNEIGRSFRKLQIRTIDLLETLKEAGCEQSYEWIMLIEKCCDVLTPLIVTEPFIVSSEDHAIKKADLTKRQSTMEDLTRVMARKLLCEGKHVEAVKAALFSLRFSIDNHGLNSVSLVPSYLTLNEASIGLGELKQADEYLAQAEWTVLKSSDSTNAIKSKLYRNIGILYATKGDYENALRVFAEDVYHSSLEWGPSHIQTTGGYFHMADVFFRMNKMDIADSLYNQVTDNWYKYLVETVQKKLIIDSKKSYLNLQNSSSKNDSFLDKDLEAEANQILNAVYDMREQSPKPNNEQFITSTYNLSMFCYLIGNKAESEAFYKKAKILVEKLPGEKYSREIPNFMEDEKNLGDSV